MTDAQGPAEAGVVVQDIVYAGLEAIGAAVPLDLCAYLHATDDQGPQLFLGAPDLASIEPTEAFSLFTALRDALQDPHEGDETMLLGGYLAIAIPLIEAGRRQGLDPVSQVRGNIGQVVLHLNCRKHMAQTIYKFLHLAFRSIPR